MKCRDIEANLDRYLTGDLSARERVRFEAHRADCEECGAVLRALSADSTGSPDFLPFLRAHRLADEHLPKLAQLDPGEEFTTQVLRRTRRLARVRRLRYSVSRWWVRQLERPQFAGEFAYALTVLMVLALIVPASPLASISRDVVDGWRAESSGEETPEWVEAGLIPVVTAPVRVIDAGERLSSSVGGELETRADALSVVFSLGKEHAKEIGGKLWERDWQALRPLLTQMRCDLQLLWDATRGTISSEDDEAFRC